MKKGIIVLLIAVLISGFAFAGTFHGSASIEFGVDFDDQSWGFANKTAGKYTFKFEFDSTTVSIGAEHKTDVWAELEAEAAAWTELKNAALANNADLGMKYTAKITKANIHVGDIIFGILNSGTAVDYAASYYDDDEDGAPDYDFLGGESRIAPGFTVTYDGWYGGFGAEGIWDDDSSTYNIWGHGKTKSFEIADGLTAEAGGYAVLDKLFGGDRYIGGGLTVDYAADKLSAGIAGDGALKKGDVNFGLEGAIYAEYAFAEEGSVRLDIYGASKEYIPYYAEDDFLLKLDAMISAGYKFTLSEDIVLDVNGFVDARDLVQESLLIAIGAEESTSIKAFDIYASETFVMFGVANKDLDPIFTLLLDFKVTYNHEKFTAWAELEPTIL
ncbi:MAG: hypothetical protein J6U27_08130, partial [Spirochaetales bacterium]|nr:hypothetical protein [Spirochaetales bacterium]